VRNDVLEIFEAVCDGLAVIEPGTVRTGTRRITVVWVKITEIGLGVLAAQR
jgi:hypothetical protein